MTLTIASFFTGAGGMDVGFVSAGFNIIWANEFDQNMHQTYRINHPNTILDGRNIFDIKSHEIPDVDGMIGGPPCQSWSAAGCNRGITDLRGQAFLEFIRILNDKNPMFFVIENVEGLTRKTHSAIFQSILNKLKTTASGYNISFQVLNASDYMVPQDRMRLFIIGIRNDLKFTFKFPEPIKSIVTLRTAIWDLRQDAIPYIIMKCTDGNAYLQSDWSSHFMSRNRVREWDECSFTIPASARHVTIHPQAPKMIKHSQDIYIFVPGSEHLYRRFTVNECARIQTFPDHYFKFDNLQTAYKMIGNAVPCKLAEAVAIALFQQLTNHSNTYTRKKIMVTKK